MPRGVRMWSSSGRVPRRQEPSGALSPVPVRSRQQHEPLRAPQPPSPPSPSPSSAAPSPAPPPLAAPPRPAWPAWSPPPAPPSRLPAALQRPHARLPPGARPSARSRPRPDAHRRRSPRSGPAWRRAAPRRGTRPPRAYRLPTRSQRRAPARVARRHAPPASRDRKPRAARVSREKASISRDGSAHPWRARTEAVLGPVRWCPFPLPLSGTLRSMGFAFPFPAVPRGAALAPGIVHLHLRGVGTAISARVWSASVPREGRGTLKSGKRAGITQVKENRLSQNIACVKVNISSAENTNTSAWPQ